MKKICLLALAVAAGCATSAPSPESKPAAMRAPAAPPARAAVVPAPIPTTPVAVDVSKFTAAVDLTGREDHLSWDEGEGRLAFLSNLVAHGTVAVPADGEYEIRVTASCAQALNEFAKFKLLVDRAAVGEVALTSEDAKEYKVAAPLKAGERKLGVEFTNDVWKEGEYDRNLFVHKIELRRTR